MEKFKPSCTKINVQNDKNVIANFMGVILKNFNNFFRRLLVFIKLLLQIINVYRRSFPINDSFCKLQGASEKEHFCQKKCYHITKVQGHSKCVSLRKRGTKIDKKVTKKQVEGGFAAKKCNATHSKNLEILRVTFFLILTCFCCILYECIC